MISYPSQFGLRENGKSFYPHIGKWRLTGNRVIGKQFEYLPGLIKIPIVLQPVLVDTFLGDAFGFIKKLSDSIDETIDQVVVQSLIPVLDKT